MAGDWPPGRRSVAVGRNRIYKFKATFGNGGPVAAFRSGAKVQRAEGTGHGRKASLSITAQKLKPRRPLGRSVRPSPLCDSGGGFGAYSRMFAGKLQFGW